MYVHRTSNGKRVHQYTCSNYSKIPVGALCSTQHRINENVVLDLVSDMLRAIANYARTDRAGFIRAVQEAQAAQQDSDIKKKKRRLAAAQNVPGSWNGWSARFMRTTPWAVCLMPGMPLWTLSTSKNRRRLPLKSQSRKSLFPVMSRAGNPLKSLSP